MPALADARQPGHHRPRLDAGDRPRGGAQAEGDVQPARRGLQRRRVPARPGGAGFLALSDPDVHADRCGGAGHAAARRRAAPHGHGAVRRRARRRRRHAAADAAARSARDRRHLPDPELLCDGRASWRSISTSTSTGRGISARSPARDERIARSRTPSPRAASSTASPCCRDSAVVIEGAHVVDVKPRARAAGVDAGAACCPTDAWLAPGFIDVQVNGGGDVLFNDTPTAGGHQRHRRRASPLRHDGAAADADQRYVRQDARCDRGGAERCGRQPERARHPHRRAVPVAREAGRARPGDVPRARRARPGAAHVVAGAAPCS